MIHIIAFVVLGLLATPAFATSLPGHCARWQIFAGADDAATTRACAKDSFPAGTVSIMVPEAHVCMFCLARDFSATANCAVLPGTTWNWFVNGPVTFNAGGTHTQGSVGGTWSCSGNTVTMNWNLGKGKTAVDTLTLSPDGKSLKGTGCCDTPGKSYNVSGSR
jgi:hypothetical protein